MNFDTYQHEAATTAIYPGKGSLTGLLYVGLGLGEAGEIQGKLKKILRDSEGVITPAIREALLEEYGDLLWYVAMGITELGADLDEVASMNLIKLASRAERGVLKGSGDTR